MLCINIYVFILFFMMINLIKFKTVCTFFSHIYLKHEQDGKKKLCLKKI
jgi:hypothetical protein